MARRLTTASSSSPLSAALAIYGTQIAVAALGLINVIEISRALGATGRGDVALLLAIPILCSHLAALGIHEANANLGAGEPELRARLAAASLLLGATLGAGAAGLAAGAIMLFPALGGEAPRHLEWLALCCVPLLVTKLYLSLLLQADRRFAITNIAWVIGPLITATGNAALLVTGHMTVAACIGLWIAGQAVGLAVLARHTRTAFGFARPAAGLVRRMVGFGLRSHVGRMMDVGNWRLDQWIVGAVAGSRELGHYSVAVAWAELLFYVPGVIVAVQRPELVRADRVTAARRAAVIMRRALILAAAAGAGLVVAAPVLCTVAMGAEFAASVPQLQVLALGAVGIVVLELLSNALVAQHRPLHASGAIGVGFATTITLDVLLIPSHGGLGAALATSCAYTAGAVAVGWVFCRELGARPRTLLPHASDVAWFWHLARPLLHR